MWQPGWERSLGESGYTLCMAESLRCPHETITRFLWIGYTPLQNKKFVINSWVCLTTKFKAHLLRHNGEKRNYLLWQSRPLKYKYIYGLTGAYRPWKTSRKECYEVVMVNAHKSWCCSNHIKSHFKLKSQERWRKFCKRRLSVRHEATLWTKVLQSRAEQTSHEHKMFSGTSLSKPWQLQSSNRTLSHFIDLFWIRTWA